ncbi:MAG: ATP-binding protein [Lachnospiraceae bacterium]|nr:ATP-binding protein [Lachnospiraceae bacterium]
MDCEVDYVRVKWLEFENTETGLKVERIDFFEDITLLVGLSGVGKTQILNAVEYSLSLAVSKDIIMRPYCVNMGIEIDGDVYEWSYKINGIEKEELLFENQEEYCIQYEKLIKNRDVIFERCNEDIRVMGYDRVPQPKKDESLLSQYSEDEEFEKLISGIRKLYSVEMELAVRGGIKSDNFNKLKARVVETIKKGNNVPFKTFSHLPAAIKIYIVKCYYKDIYIKIFEAVKELFMEIEDIDVVEDEDREMYLVAIQVYGKKLLQHDISNGMLKTIYYIVELFTMSDDSLVLIDEFENGLGVNCIDLLSEILLYERKDLQFIITSHHPKIINGIEQNRWKIIDRDGTIVKNSNSDKYGIGNSQHEAYFNLINRWEFEGKI